MRVLHLQNWNADAIKENIPVVKEQGFDACLIGPVQPLKEDGYKEWWMSYQITDFKIGNIYISKEDLISICELARKYQLDIHVDTVLNHTGASLEDPLTPHLNVNPILLSNPLYWKEKINVSNWDDRKDVTTHCMGLPGLNVYHPDIQKMISKFLNELIDTGVMGFRFDAAKSIGLPSEGYDFWPNIIYCLKKWGLFLYGEIICENNQQILEEYAKYINVLGSYVINNPSRSVLYVESHDSFLSDTDLGYTKYKSSNQILQEYTNLVANHLNTLFYARPFDNIWQDERIKDCHNMSLKRIKKSA